MLYGRTVPLSKKHGWVVAWKYMDVPCEVLKEPILTVPPVLRRNSFEDSWGCKSYSNQKDQTKLSNATRVVALVYTSSQTIPNCLCQLEADPNTVQGSRDIWKLWFDLNSSSINEQIWLSAANTDTWAKSHMIVSAIVA